MRPRCIWCSWRSALAVTVVAACSTFLPVAPAMAPSRSQREGPTALTYRALRDRGGFWRNLGDTLRYGETMEFVPVSTYHLRFAYTPEKIASYTEWPLGLGFGRALTDAQGNRREVFAIVHEDSAARVQYNLGYIYFWSQPLLASSRSVTLGAGYVLLLMGRWDWSYVPLPLILPIASLTVSRVSVESTFVPGWIGYGNVLFTWLQFRL